ncbi:MAG: alpha/beta fold hydrolase, partial [Candidatus Binatia bacterium]
MSTVTTSDQRTLHWVESGSGSPILLIHGFAANLDRNWRGTGWFDALVRSGWRVIAFDQRGHGQSEKLYEPMLYAPDRLARDVVEILDAAAVDRAVLMGYSMGARVALDVAMRSADRCRALVLGGMGRNFFPDLGGPDREYEVIAATLEADDPSPFPPLAQSYRVFAQQTGGDLKALAACWRRPRPSASRSELSAIRLPTLVVVGERDEIAGDGKVLAEAIPGAEFVLLRGKDHLKAVGAKEHRGAVLAFLE